MADPTRSFPDQSNINYPNTSHYDNERHHHQLQQQQTLPSSPESLSSFSHSHLETDTTHSRDPLTSGISRTSTPAPHYYSPESDTSSLTTRQAQFPIPQSYTYGYDDKNHAVSQQSEPPHKGMYMPPTESPPTQPPYPPSTSYPTSQNDHSNWHPPPDYQPDPPKYATTGKSNSDVILEVGNSSYRENNLEEIKASLQSDRSVRMAFVRKVYFLLLLQLMFTILFSVFFMYYEPVKTFVNTHVWLFFVSWILTFATLIVLFWQRKRSPFNLILLILFTVFMSYGIGTIVSMYSSKVVLQSFLTTFGVFIALQVFTLQTKYDFSSWGPFLYASLWIVIFASIIGWLFPYEKGYHMAISIVSALLFSAYIIYDTYMIFKRLSPEEYILAAVDLYLDILNLFVAILAIIGGTSDR